MEAMLYEQITEEQFGRIGKGKRIRCEDRNGRTHIVEKRSDGSVYFYPDCGWTGRKVDPGTLLKEYRFCVSDPEKVWTDRLDDILARLHASGLNKPALNFLQQIRRMPYREAMPLLDL